MLKAHVGAFEIIFGASKASTQFFTRRKIEDLPKGDGGKQGARVRVFISGLNPQGIGGGAWSSFVEDANPF
jgi:hypothetical protein